jgi:hypothetical protein
MSNERSLRLILEDTILSDKIIKTYRDDADLTTFLKTNDIGFVTMTYTNEKVSNAGMGEIRPGIPNWYFYNDEGVIKKHLVGRPHPQDLIDELKAFYKIK